ncbi:LuxR C-terminal-related transcriptional regulator [Thermodesulfobacteriota bacterium]
MRGASTPEPTEWAGKDDLPDRPENYAGVFIDSLPANSAIIDEHGIIRATNRAWQEFGVANNIRSNPDGIGVNYLTLCDSADELSVEKAREVAQGLRDIIARERREFIIDYSLHRPEEDRWFRMRAVRLPGCGPLRVLISHENITKLKRTEENLSRREAELRLQKGNLETVNIALQVLLARREEERQEFRERILANVRQHVYPQIEELKRTRLSSRQIELVGMIEAGLNDIASPFVQRLSSKYLNLTNREIQVAGLIIEGKATKEIADILNVSTNTVSFHRKSIRRKSGLRRKGVSLRAYLLSIDTG